MSSICRFTLCFFLSFLSKIRIYKTLVLESQNFNDITVYQELLYQEYYKNCGILTIGNTICITLPQKPFLAVQYFSKAIV